MALSSRGKALTPPQPGQPVPARPVSAQPQRRAVTIAAALLCMVFLVGQLGVMSTPSRPKRPFPPVHTSLTKPQRQARRHNATFVAVVRDSVDVCGVVPSGAVRGAIDVSTLSSVAELWNRCLGDAHGPRLILRSSTAPLRGSEQDALLTRLGDNDVVAESNGTVVVDVKAARDLGGFDTNLRPSSAGLVADLALRHAAGLVTRDEAHANPVETGTKFYRAVARATGIPVARVQRGWPAVIATDAPPTTLKAKNFAEGPPPRRREFPLQRPTPLLEAQATFMTWGQSEFLGRQGRCNAAWYLRTKWRPGRGPGAALVGLAHLRPWAPYGGALVTGDSEIAGAAVPDAAQQRRFRDCVDTGAGLRLVVGDRREHCLMPTSDEMALQSPGPLRTTRVTRLPAGWVERTIARLSVLLRIGQAYPWRNDRVPSYLLPLTPFDAGLLEYHVASVDAPLGCASVLLNLPGPFVGKIEEGMRHVEAILRGRGLAFRYQHHPENLGVSGAWNRLSRYAIAEMHRSDAERAGPAALKEASALAAAENVTADGPEFAAVQAAVLRVRGEAYREGFVWLAQPDASLNATWLAHGRRWMQGIGHRHPYSLLIEYASMFVTVRALVDRLGFFDENVFPAYGEDVEYWLRMRTTGLTEARPLPAGTKFHIRSTTKRSSGSVRTLVRKRWRRQQYMWRKWGFLMKRWRRDPEGKDKTQFHHPWNSVLIPVNESWRVVDHQHIECIKSGVGPTYEVDPQRPTACNESCLFDMRKVEAVWPKAFARENLAPMDVALPAKYPTSLCLPW